MAQKPTFDKKLSPAKGNLGHFGWTL